MRPARSDAERRAQVPVRHGGPARARVREARRRAGGLPAVPVLVVAHHGRLPRSQRGVPTAREARGGGVHRRVPGHLPRRRRLRARSARSPDGTRPRAARRRAEERRFAPRVHRRRPSHLRHVRQPAERAGLLRGPRRHERGQAPLPPHAGHRLPPRGDRGAAPDRGAGLEPPGGLDQPQGPAPRRRRRARGVRPQPRRAEGPAAPVAARRASATPA